MVNGVVNDRTLSDEKFVIMKKRIGRFAFKSPTWIIIKKNHLISYRR